MFIIRIILIASLLLVLSCSKNCIDYNINVDKQKISLKYNHLEKELFSAEIDNEAKHNYLIHKYDRLYSLFYSQMLMDC